MPAATKKRKSRKKTPKRTIVSSQRKVSQHFGVNIKTVKDWLDKGCPGKVQNYCIEDITEWRKKLVRRPEDNQAELARRGQNPDLLNKMNQAKLDAQQARARKLVLDVETAELTRKLVSDDYITVGAVNDFLAKFFTELRHQHSRIPVNGAAAFGNRGEFFKDYMTKTLNQVQVHMHAWTLDVEDLVTKEAS